MLSASDSAMSEVVLYARKMDQWMRGEGRAALAKQLGVKPAEKIAC